MYSASAQPPGLAAKHVIEDHPCTIESLKPGDVITNGNVIYIYLTLKKNIYAMVRALNAVVPTKRAALMALSRKFEALRKHVHSDESRIEILKQYTALTFARVPSQTAAPSPTPSTSAAAPTPTTSTAAHTPTSSAAPTSTAAPTPTSSAAPTPTSSTAPTPTSSAAPTPTTSTAAPTPTSSAAPTPVTSTAATPPATPTGRPHSDRSSFLQHRFTVTSPLSPVKTRNYCPNCSLKNKEMRKMRTEKNEAKRMYRQQYEDKVKALGTPKRLNEKIKRKDAQLVKVKESAKPAKTSWENERRRLNYALQQKDEQIDKLQKEAEKIGEYVRYLEDELNKYKASELGTFFLS